MVMSDAPVLIFGEHGTGRTTLAQHIHWRSNHFGRPLFILDCKSLPNISLEQSSSSAGSGVLSRLLAHCTGPTEIIEGAALLLNDVDQLDMPAQTLLLRGLREQDENDTQSRTKVRIFATCSTDLRGAVARLTFLSELYFRLNVLPLSVPRLRDRRDDIAPLARYFAHRHAATYHRTIDRVSQAAVAKLIAYPWFGNVLELCNVIHRAVLTTTCLEIGPEDILLDFPTSALTSIAAEGLDSGREFVPRLLEDIKRDTILKTLVYTAGNRRQAAKLLGMGIRTLHSAIQEYMLAGLQVPAAPVRIAA